LSVADHGSSAWAQSYRIDTVNDDGGDESYFMKVRLAKYDTGLSIHPLLTGVDNRSPTAIMG